MADFKTFRKLNKLTQQQAAEYFGCLQSFISQIETGRSAVPDSFISKILEDGIYELPANMSRVVEVSTNIETSQPKMAASKDSSELQILAKLVNSLQDTVATQKALINIYEAEIKRLQRAVQFKESGKRAASALPDSEEF